MKRNYWLQALILQFSLSAARSQRGLRDVEVKAFIRDSQVFFAWNYREFILSCSSNQEDISNVGEGNNISKRKKKLKNIQKAWKIFAKHGSKDFFWRLLKMTSKLHWIELSALITFETMSCMSNPLAMKEVRTLINLSSCNFHPSRYQSALIQSQSTAAMRTRCITITPNKSRRNISIAI